MHNEYNEQRLVSAVNGVQWMVMTGVGCYLWEVADEARAVLVHLAQDVEEERLDVEVESLVIEEQFG